MTTPEWSDDDLIDYCYWHSRTELHLFHRDHIERLFKLAGKEEEWKALDVIAKFIGVDQWRMEPLVKAARERCRQAP
jgi:hypothetical protein